MNTEVFGIILNVIAPVMLCAAVGFIWAKRGYAFDTALVTRLVSNVGLPCIVFATLSTVTLDLDVFVTMGTMGFLTTGSFIIVGYVVVRLLRLETRTYLNPIAFANTGNMGLPLCLFAFGEQGLALGIAYFVVNIIMLVTIGIALASASFDLKRAFKQPVIYSAIASVLVVFGLLEVPEVIIKTTDLLGGLTIPLMLITLGVSLATLKVESLGPSLLIAGARLGFGILVGFGAVWVFGLEGTAAGVVILMCAMPVAVINFLLAEANGADGRAVAGAVVVSTFLAFASLPLLLWVLLGG